MMNNEKFSTLMYALTKESAKHSFVDFLEYWDVTEDEYAEIKQYLKETYNVKTYC